MLATVNLPYIKCLRVTKFEYGHFINSYFITVTETRTGSSNRQYSLYRRKVCETYNRNRDNREGQYFCIASVNPLTAELEFASTYHRNMNTTNSKGKISLKIISPYLKYLIGYESVCIKRDKIPLIRDYNHHRALAARTIWKS